MTENIKIAIIGPVSAGKSTFFNALCSNTCSEMKRKKTTMLPQIYQTTDNLSIVDSIETIYEKNKKSNEEILIKRETGQFVLERDFREIMHTIKVIPDFINLKQNTTYSILDMPGLNCGGETIYYDYIRKNSSSIDIYVLVFDINSGLNTTDEINIIKMVVEEIKKNNNGYMHILINKCDEITFKKNKPCLEDEELDELYNRSIDIIQKICTESSCKFSISPLCSSRLYIFRSVKNNIDVIDESQLDNIIKIECGKQELKKLNTVAKKRKFISGMLNDKSVYGDWMKSTGYNCFQEYLNKIIVDNYNGIIYYHINISLQKICKDLNQTTNIDEIIEKLEEINIRISNLKSEVPKEIIGNINIINEYCNNYLKNGVDTYTASSVKIADVFLNKIVKYYTLIAKWFKINPLIESYTVIENKKYKLLNDEFIQNYDYTIYKQLTDKKLITDEILRLSITNTLTRDINKVNAIFNDLKNKHDITILIESFLLTYTKMNFNDFIICVENILSIKDLLELELSYITKVYKLYYKTDNHYTNYWLNLNFSKINEYSKDIKYIYLEIYQHMCNSSYNLSNKQLMSLDELDEYYNNMDRLHSLLIKYLHNTIQNTTHNNIYETKTKTKTIIKSKPISKIDIESESETENIFKNCNEDDQTEQYYDSDNSDIIYEKATKNTAVRASIILANGD
jgi:GTPase SAR1 family protein